MAARLHLYGMMGTGPFALSWLRSSASCVARGLRCDVRGREVEHSAQPHVVLPVGDAEGVALVADEKGAVDEIG